MPLLTTPAPSHCVYTRVAQKPELEQITILVREVIKHERPEPEQLLAAFEDPNAACLTLSERVSGLPRAVTVVRVHPESETGEIVHLAALHPAERDELLSYAERWLHSHGADQVECSPSLRERGLRRSA